MLRPVDTFDAVIIGGGIAGVSTAFHLSRRGCRVAVLERKFVAAGATGRSSGLVRMHYDLEAESRLAWASISKTPAVAGGLLAGLAVIAAVRSRATSVRKEEKP